MLIRRKTKPKLLLQQFVCLLLIAETLTGCNPRDRVISYLGKPDRDYAQEAEQEYYRGVSTEIAYPDVNEPTPENVSQTRKPRTLRERISGDVVIWDMTLVEALHLALANNKVVRRNDRSTLQANSSQVMTNPDGIASVYDPAIQESGVLFGNRGVESALSAFDTQLSASMLWGKANTIQNNSFSAGGLPAGGVLHNDTGAFQSALTKNTASGAQIQLFDNWNYSANNFPSNLFPQTYTGSAGASLTQPLLAGGGPEYTRIAGPLGTNIQGVSGVNQGVLIARINEDISIADFERNVTDMLFDTEKLYWDLYYAYRQYDSATVNLMSALRTWREVKAKADIGAKGGGAADEAQARETYFTRRAAEESALANIDFQETGLRRICGLTMNDGRIIRPADEPINAEFIPEWYTSLAEALTRRVELRRQKWTIKSLDLQLSAAKNLTQPQLNFVSSYQLNGFGKDLASYRQQDFKTNENLHSAISNLIQGNNPSYTVGFNFQMPIGFRAALAQVRNIELRIAKAREVLATQEEEISFELAAAFQDLSSNFVNAQTNFNRRRAAEREVQAFTAEYQAGTRTLDLLLQAQARQADAENAYYNSIITYTKSIAHINYRKGTLLDLDNVHLAEGEWSPEAYNDALRQAWARAAASDTNIKHTQPPAFVSPGIVGTTELAAPDSEFQRNAPPPEYPDNQDDVPQMTPPPVTDADGDFETPRDSGQDGAAIDSSAERGFLPPRNSVDDDADEDE